MPTCLACLYSPKLLVEMNKCMCRDIFLLNFKRKQRPREDTIFYDKPIIILIKYKLEY
jgi:hypothetical protein